MALDLLDATDELLAAIAKAAPDLLPIHHCNGSEVDIEVPDQDTAASITLLLDGHRVLRATPIYDGGYGGTIAGCPVRVLITRTRRGSVWAA